MIKYKNYVYLLPDYSYVLRYNLLKNNYVALIKCNFQCESCAIIEDKILIARELGMSIIYDCSINSLSTVFHFQLLGSKCIGAINRTFL